MPFRLESRSRTLVFILAHVDMSRGVHHVGGEVEDHRGANL